MANIKLNVSGITCGGCERSIRNALLAKDGVREAVASHKSGSVEIDFDDSRIQRAGLQKTIEDAGFEVTA